MTALADVGAHHIEILLRRLVISRNHVTAREAAFDDFDIAHVRREDRRHARTIDTGQEKQFVGRRLQRGQEFLVVDVRSEEHTSELQSLMRISYAVFCLKKKKYIQIIIESYLTSAI